MMVEYYIWKSWANLSLGVVFLHLEVWTDGKGILILSMWYCYLWVVFKQCEVDRRVNGYHGANSNCVWSFSVLWYYGLEDLW